MGSHRTLKRRRQRQYRKLHPHPKDGIGLATPSWIVREVLDELTASTKLMSLINRKY